MGRPQKDNARYDSGVLVAVPEPTPIPLSESSVKKIREAATRPPPPAKPVVSKPSEGRTKEKA